MSMTRSEFELELTKRLEDVMAVYKQYNPEAFTKPGGLYLNMNISDRGISANNRYFEHDESNPDFRNPVTLFKPLGGTEC